MVERPSQSSQVSPFGCDAAAARAGPFVEPEPSFDDLMSLCRSAVWTLVAEALTSVVVALTVVAQAKTSAAAIWLVVVWATLMLRALCCYNLRLQTDATQAGLWRWVLGTAMAISGAIWGSFVFFSAPVSTVASIEIMAAVLLGTVFLSRHLIVAAAYIASTLIVYLVAAHLTPVADLGVVWSEAAAAAAIATSLVVTRTLLQQNRRLKASFLDSQKRARVAIEAKSNFIANMSHELRTPLNAIIGFSELIQSEAFGPLGHPRYRDYVSDIRDSGRHLLAVVNDILDMSKIEAGRLQLANEDVDVGEIIDRCVLMMRTAAGKAGIAMSVVLPDRPVRLHVDERSLKQIVSNLVSNAVKFTPRSGTVRIELHERATGDVEIAVVDSGIGIAAENIAIVMEPFGQVDASFARRFEGTGLGLPLVKSLTELQDGRFELESELAVGTTARVIFPAHRRIANDDAASDPAPDPAPDATQDATPEFSLAAIGS